MQAIGRNPEEYRSREGVFDWLLGAPQASADYNTRWTRDIVAMSLRGLQWTAPGGALLLVLGAGWLPLVSGAMMGPVCVRAARLAAAAAAAADVLRDGGARRRSYEVGWRWEVAPTAFWGQGTAVAEALWGYWIWLTLLVTVRVPRDGGTCANGGTGGAVRFHGRQTRREAAHSAHRGRWCVVAAAAFSRNHIRRLAQ